MLSEMPVAELSLNELSRRVGLAKSNVLRYFESREGVLLDLFAQLARDFLSGMVGQLRAVDVRQPVQERVISVSAALASAFAAQDMFCELLSSQAGVLERNVSAETVVRYKREGHAILGDFAGAIHEAIPELDMPRAREAARTIMLLVGAYWSHVHPPQAVQDAYAADPGLNFLPEGLRASLERSLTVLFSGLLVV